MSHNLFDTFKEFKLSSGATGLTTNYTIRVGDTLSVSNGIVVGITSGS